jgi:hypothetical protein
VLTPGGCTPEECQRIAQAAVLREWAALIESGLATREILRHWHSRLADYSNEFEPGVAVEQMRLLVDDRLGVDQSDLLPDFPPDELPPHHDRREW